MAATLAARPQLRIGPKAVISQSEAVRAGRTESLEASAAAYGAVHTYMSRAKAAGRYVESTFADRRLGFTVALARRTRPRGETRARQTWCTLTVEDVDRPDLVLSGAVLPGDELVSVEGDPVAVRDDEAYDDARRAAAFGVIKENIKDGPRPVRLGFVRTTGSGDRRSSWFERRAMEAEDRPAVEDAWRSEGQRVRDEADAAWEACSGPVEGERQRAAKALRGIARRARRRVVDAREQYEQRVDPSRALDEAEATDAHCVARRAASALEVEELSTA
eukprot:CAMPEP_0119265094 /NCGR_PEP_ID=MMETSP1329-20130426/3997_1 /TAXON_ID=114041 /ORGANISM="Genus nov. species nov., Strain RCC1024" /LENGTH=275 /DNA_ID=CAMNT_0007264903 /DNA_START=207 /DNA_END=1030 /DNA_ORIENTATION=-